MLCTILFHIHQNFGSSSFGERRKKYMTEDGVIGHFNFIWNTFIHLLKKDEANMKKTVVFNSKWWKYWYFHIILCTSLHFFYFFKTWYVSITVPHYILNRKELWFLIHQLTIHKVIHKMQIDLKNTFIKPTRPFGCCI